MRMTATLLLALLVAGACDLDSAGNLGREWNSLDDTETSLIFIAPGLDAAGKRFMYSQAPDNSHSTEF